MPKRQVIDLSGEFLARGFWLYVWEITTPGRGRKKLLYVGRTGDSSSLNAQSPFNRMGQHLGWNKKNNRLRARLGERGLSPEKCEFRLVAYGPVLEEALPDLPKDKRTKEHRRRRDCVAWLEMKLAADLCAADYKVMNPVNCNKPPCESLYPKVKRAFAQDFPQLGSKS